MSVERPNFPVTTTCPLCRENELYIFDDVVSNSVWLCCNSCKRHGDIITFGAQIWNTSLPDTVEKFSTVNVISGQDAAKFIPEYARFTAKLSAAEQFWIDAESQAWNHADDVIACRLREFGMRYEVPACFGLVGVAHLDQIRKLCAALGRPKPIQAREDGPALVYPFYDLPQRLTGFLISQYNEAFELRQNFIPISGFKKRRPEAGYFLLNTVLQKPEEQFRGNVFVSEDIHWVVKTQAKYAGKANKFLPLLASYSGPEAESYGTSWSAFNFAPRIFHANAASPNLISRACNARGYVSVVFPRQPTPEANLTSIRIAATTWQKTLTKSLLSADEINAQSFAEKLTIPHDKLSAYLNKLTHPFSPGFADRVIGALDLANPSPQQKWLIIERDSGWWNHLGRQISNVCPRITRVIQTDVGEKIYVGTITAADGSVYSFNDNAKKIEAMGLLEYSAAVLAPHKKLVFYEHAWNARSHLYAIKLHEPEIVVASTQYGWDQNNKVFRFNRYEITEKGHIKHTPEWSRNSGITFDDPLPVAPIQIHEWLTPEHENSYAWNIVAAIVGNLVAPIANVDPYPVALCNTDFKTVIEIAKALCCPIERATSAHKYNANGFFARFNDDVIWPTLVYNTFGDEILSNIVPRYSNRPLLVKLSETSRAAAPGYGWQTIVHAKTKTGLDTQVFRHVLPAFVQHILTENVTPFKLTDNPQRKTLQTLHAWLLATYGAAFNIAHAESLVRGPENAHLALFEALQNAFAAKKLHVLPQPRLRSQPRNFILQKKDCWWVNRNAIDRYFYLARSVAPNWLAVVDLMQQDGIYIGEQTIHNMVGFLVNRDWCEQFWRDDNYIDQETG